MLPTRTQTCPVCPFVIDNHTRDEMERCASKLTPSRLGTIVLPKIDQSWNWRLPERYQA